MKSQKSLCLFLIFIDCLLSSSHGYRNFFVGGKGGWILHPTEQYNHWAGRQRFQINDTLIFKYKEGSDSVLLVHKDDYFNCNMKNPIKKMESGCSEFQFPHSGPFFFISGKEGHCQKGQKLITCVMAERQRPPFDPSPGPSPSPSPKHHGPVAGPAPAPFSGPALPPSPHGHVSNPPEASTPTPAAAPAELPSNHHSPPSGPPSYSPMAHPPKASSPSPFSTSPQASIPPPSHDPVEAPPPTSTPPAPPHATSPSGPPPSPTTGTPADDSSPVAPPSKSSATATFSSVILLAASNIFAMVLALGNFISGS